MCSEVTLKSSLLQFGTASTNTRLYHAKHKPHLNQGSLYFQFLWACSHFKYIFFLKHGHCVYKVKEENDHPKLNNISPV